MKDNRIHDLVIVASVSAVVSGVLHILWMILVGK